ncbi:MAG: hypothetical protein PHI15_03380 [Methanomicrobium sp.]|nr:hypothetical protein [Methanomicrobium sp.]
MEDSTYRLFAGELELLERLNQNKGELLLLPDGKTVNNIYLCGALTEVKKGPGGYVSSVRIADPTGVFVLYCRKNRSYCSSEFLKVGVPSFVSVFGEVKTSKRIFNSEKTRFFINPQAVREITKEERDRWILSAADFALERLEKSVESFENKNPEMTDDSEIRNIFEISNDSKELIRIIETAISNVSSNASEKSTENVEYNISNTKISNIKKTDSQDKTSCPDIEHIILEIIKKNSTKKGLLLKDFYSFADSAGLNPDDVKSSAEKLIKEGELYLPPGGYIKIL